jgi:hypothetical protein
MAKNTKDLKKIAGMVTLMLVFATAGYYAGKIGLKASQGLDKPVITSLLLLLIPLFLFVIGIHEAGHALAGKWVQFSFRMYVVGPFIWTKEADGWHFEWNKHLNLAGGMVVCLPADNKALSKRFSIYAAGGPLASFALAIITFLLYRWLYIPGVNAGTVLTVISYASLITAFLSVLIGIVTSIPMHTGGFSTDGARILRLLRGGDTARFETLMIQIYTSSTSGVRPALLNRDDLQEALTLARRLQAPLGVYLHSFFHQAAFDRGDIDTAEKYLLDYILATEEIPAAIRNMVWLDAAFFYAYAKKDLTTATGYWAKFKPAAMIPKALILATEAAICAVKNDFGTAQTKAKAALREIPNMMDKGIGLALRDKMTDLQKKTT